MHRTIEPAIHYWGTPVVLISTLNPDGTPNLAPMSSAWWIGWSCMLGLDASSQTALNLQRERECVLNLASVAEAPAVDRLARLSGRQPLPPHKQFLDYRFEADKFGAAGLSPQPSTDVKPPRVQECQVQLEAVLSDVRPFGASDVRTPISTLAFELRIVRTHVAPALLQNPEGHRINPEAWQPLVMMFRELRGGLSRVQDSRLHHGPEEAYAPWKFPKA